MPGVEAALRRRGQDQDAGRAAAVAQRARQDVLAHARWNGQPPSSLPGRPLAAVSDAAPPAPTLQILQLRCGAVGAGIGRWLSQVGEPHGHRLQTRALAIDPPHKELAKRDVAHQHRRDRQG